MTVLDLVRFRAVIFDLDGVVTQTAAVHSAAWKELFESYLDRPFPDEDYRRYVDGKPRYEGVRDYLAHCGKEDLPWGSPDDPPTVESICGLGNRKNTFFAAQLAEHGVAVYPSSIDLIDSLRSLGVHIAVVTSSKNCDAVLRAAHLEGVFEVQIDGVIAAKEGLAGKPKPDTFVEAARRLGVSVAHAVVIEDAVSGVQAGKAGGFGLVVGVNRADQERALHSAGADLVVRDLAEVAVPKPSAMGLIDHLRSEQIALFLDYDGTLVPIVERPEQAVLADTMREVIHRVASRYFVAVVTGRDRVDVERVSGLHDVIIAGSHGFDIRGPGRDQQEGVQYEYPEAKPLVKILQQVADELERALAPIGGAWVERKRFALAIHYRQVAEQDIPFVDAAVDRVWRAYTGLRRAGGKKIFELKPDLDWDKGRAVLWLQKHLGLQGHTLLYLGDDVTDEDAFRALRGRGIGICVQENLRLTAADYLLHDVKEVEQFLKALS